MNQQKTQQLLVFWVMWAAFFTGIFVIFHFLGGAQKPVAPDGSPIYVAGLFPVLLGIGIRWVAMPRFKTAQMALPFFILGIAMSEMTCFLGLFVFPAHKQTLFAASAIGIFQFAPTFVSRYFADTDSTPGA